MKYYFTPSAVKNLRELSAAAQKRIIAKLDFYMQASEPLIFAKSLKNKQFGEYRFRIGEYRVIFDIRGSDIIILALGNRKDIYR